MEEKKDRRVSELEWWHEQVFGRNPTRSAVPFQVMRDYADYERELRRAQRGIDDAVLALSIPEIKARGREYYIRTGV